MVLAGCGVRAGAIHGVTARGEEINAEHPEQSVQDPVTVADVHATMLQAIGIDHSVQLQTPIGRPMTISEGIPIKSVLS